jgi:hypothetical protein
MNMYSTFYDAVLGRLVALANPSGPAPAWTPDCGWQKTPGCTSTMPNCCAYAPTHTDPEARRADFGAARDLARRQGAPLFVLRSALDDFELRGEFARGPSRTRQSLPEGRRVAGTRAGPSQPH